MLTALVVHSEFERRWAVLPPQRVASLGLELDSELGEMRLASAAGHIIEVSEDAPSSRLSSSDHSIFRVVIAVRLKSLPRLISNELHGLDVRAADSRELGDAR